MPGKEFEVVTDEGEYYDQEQWAGRWQSRAFSARL